MSKRKRNSPVPQKSFDDIPIRPQPAPPDGSHPIRFRRGHKYPTAIAWFGFRSFWGHLWSLIASAIATEDIDSRDWMRADEPSELLDRMALHFGGYAAKGSLTEALGRDVWIDFIADTGDDVSVSRAVADMMFRRYVVDDPDAPGADLELPRGDILLFGGDTAYPVASELEIHNRVIVPFNRVLRDRLDGTPRVLLGLPGNHDWFAGLDGFGRMFRAPLGTIDRTSIAVSIPPSSRAPGDVQAAIDTRIDRAGQLGHFFEWMEALRIGKRVEKRAALPLLGYTPVQSASYWVLPLAPALDLWGPDRQLTTLDTRQRMYFARRRDDEENGIVMCMADPPYAFLRPHPHGQDILNSLDVSFEEDKLLAITGDIHHYCRLEFPGGGSQVTAGGGGAFLHPARISRRGLILPAAELPGPISSRALTLKIPMLLAGGRAGLILHAALAIAYGPMQKIALTDGHPSVLTAAITGAVLWVLLTLLAYVRGPSLWKVIGLAGLSSAVLSAVPFGINFLATALAPKWPYALEGMLALAFLAMVLIGVAVFGTYLMLLTIFGLATDQGFGPLAHPGYKHFVRLRVKRDGSKVEGWALAKVDTLRRGEEVVLADKFEWHNPKYAAPKPSSTVTKRAEPKKAAAKQPEDA